MIHAYRGVVPKVHLSAWLADSADVIGDVELGEESSVWFSTVVRGDVNFIRVGRGTNLQDGSVVHVNRNGTPTIRSARSYISLAAEYRAVRDA